MTQPSSPPTYYWAIVKTYATDLTNSHKFASDLAQIVSHELVEQFVDRNGSFAELGDACQGNPLYSYRGWQVQQFLSAWDSTATQCLNNKNCVCINLDGPVSLKRFLTAIGFDFQKNGLSQLGTLSGGNPPVININYIASTMQSQDTEFP